MPAIFIDAPIPKGRQFGTVKSAMNDSRKTKDQLISELQDSRRRIRELERPGKESSEYYRLLFDSTNDAAFVYYLTKNQQPGRFVEVNDVACRILHYSREELLTMDN